MKKRLLYYELVKYLEHKNAVLITACGRRVRPLSKSIDRAVAGGRKVYFTDTGMSNIIGQVNEGQLFENGVINQLSHFGKVSFYNKRNAAEIDAIVDKHTAFEIKLTGTSQDIAKLSKLSSDLGISKSFVISKKFQEQDRLLSPVVL